MRVLVVTKIYPNAAEPLSAPFNRQQVAALARRCSVEVLATVPLVSRRRRSPAPYSRPRVDRDGVPVARQRTPYLPRYGHALSAGLYAAAVWPELRARRGQLNVILGCRTCMPTAWPWPRSSRALNVPAVVKVHGSDLDVLRPSGQPCAGRWRSGLPLGRPGGRGRPGRWWGEQPSRWASARARIESGDERRRRPALFHPRDDARGARRAGARRAIPRRWIVCVSRLREDKGTLESGRRPSPTLSQVSATTCCWTLVGDGEARGARRRLRLRPFGNRVILSGARPLAEVPLWMGRRRRR